HPGTRGNDLGRKPRTMRHDLLRRIAAPSQHTAAALRRGGDRVITRYPASTPHSVAASANNSKIRAAVSSTPHRDLNRRPSNGLLAPAKARLSMALCQAGSTDAETTNSQRSEARLPLPRGCTGAGTLDLPAPSFRF